MIEPMEGVRARWPLCPPPRLRLLRNRAQREREECSLHHTRPLSLVSRPEDAIPARFAAPQLWPRRGEPVCLPVSLFLRSGSDDRPFAQRRGVTRATGITPTFRQKVESID